MKLYVIDKEGWVDVHENEYSVEQSLETIDINNNEYKVIDSLGYVYGWQPNSKNYSGFKLVHTQEINTELMAKVNHQNAQQFKI